MVEPRTDSRKKERSPNYPAIDLETALARARVLREKEGRNFTPVSAVFKHWGYSSRSSGGLTTLAALKRFGLLDEQGAADSRQVRLSQFAQKILLDDRPGSQER